MNKSKFHLFCKIIQIIRKTQTFKCLYTITQFQTWGKLNHTLFLFFKFNRSFRLYNFSPKSGKDSCHQCIDFDSVKSEVEEAHKSVEASFLPQE